MLAFSCFFLLLVYIFFYAIIVAERATSMNKQTLNEMKDLSVREKIDFINAYNRQSKIDFNLAESLAKFEQSRKYSMPIDDQISNEFTTFLDNGEFGMVYVNDSKTLIYKESMRGDFNIDKMEFFTSLNFPNFCFPTELVYHVDVSNQIALRGYIAKYVDSMDIHKLDKTVTLEDYKKAILTAGEDLLKISKFGVIMDDLHEYNFLFDKTDKRFKFIDLDSYEIGYVKDIYLNQNEFENTLFRIHSFDKKTKLCSFDISDLKNLYTKFRDKKITLLEFMEYYVPYLENYYEKKINTFQDYRDCSVKLLKK